MNEASISKGKVYLVDIEKDICKINGNTLNWDIATLGHGRYHILVNRKSYLAEVIEIDNATKTVCIRINNRKITTRIQSEVDILIRKMGIQRNDSRKLKMVKAPMPGLIVDLRVEVGAMIKIGDPLLVLEAMKMENTIKSPCDGEIKAIKVQKGDSVERNQGLIEF